MHDTEFQPALPEVLRSIVERAGAKMVYGDPVTVGGKVVLPVAKVAYGFGGGWGANPEHRRHGSGGGGGVMAKPLGVVEVTESETRFVPIGSTWTVFGAIGLGLILGWAIGCRRPDSRS